MQLSLHSTVALLSFVLCIMMGFNAYYRDLRALSNRLFAFFFFSLAAQSLVDFGYLSSRNFEQAAFWWRVDLAWPIAPTFLLLAIIATARKEYLFGKLWFSLLVYLPVVVALISEISVDAVTGPPQPFGEGWSGGAPKNSLIGAIAFIWTLGILGASALLSIVLMRRAKTRSAKRQFFILAAGVLLAMSFILANLVHLTIYGRSLLIATYVYLAFTLSIGYFVRLHGKFLITPISTVEKIMSTMFDSIFLLDEKFRIRAANRAVTALFNYEESDLLGRSMKILVPENSNLPNWIDSLDTKKEAGHPTVKYCDAELLRGNGETLPVYIGGTAIYDEEDNLGGFLLLARDMSEKRELELELETYKTHLEELVASRTRELKMEMASRIQAEKDNAILQGELFQSQKMDAVGKLASGVAHDFNNLLQVIGGFTDELIYELPLTDPLQNDLKEIAKATRSAAAITKQLLAFSRKQTAKPQVVELNETVETALKMIQKLLGEGVRLSFEPSETACRIRIDPSQLDQILANLAVNASYAMPGGGTLTLAVGTEEISVGESQELSGKRAGTYCALSVRDTGVGMSADVVNRVFEPFFTTRKTGEGTGLGLPVVYGIVTQNRGYIDVSSSLGQGTEFKIFLPLVDEAVEQKAKTKPCRTPRGVETILLVEDHIQVKTLTTRLLTGQGYTVLAASSGEQAMAVFERHGDTIDLVVSDVVMPGIDGKTLAQRLQKQKPELKVILISGHNDYALDETGQQEGSIPFLKKPFEPEQLRNLVREVLDLAPTDEIR